MTGTEQFDLFDVPEKDRTLAEYDAANPHIWRGFVALAENRIHRGFKHYSARDILAVLRWNTQLGGDDEFKINNNISSYFARKWLRMGLHPELPDFFELRRAPKAEREIGEQPCRDSGQRSKSRRETKPSGESRA